MDKTLTYDGSNGWFSRPRIGSLINDRYRVIEDLGSGGMGSVVLADDLLVTRRVAIKFFSDSELRTLERILDPLQRIKSPHLLAIYHVDVCDGIPFLVMEHAPGGSLRNTATLDKMSLRQRCRVLEAVLAGLNDLHHHQILHLDIKPGNILIDSDLRPLLADFGLSCLCGERPAVYGGTDGYLAPEQKSCGNVDKRSDIFSLGRLIRFMFTDLRIPLLWKKIAERACQTDPRQRWSSIDQIIRLISRRRRIQRLFLLAILTAGIVGAGIAITPRLDINPAMAKVETNALTLHNRHGRVLWTVTGPFEPAHYTGNDSPRFRLADLDGDGRNEVLLTRALNSQEGAHPSLDLYDDDGRLLWRQRFETPLQTETGEQFLPPFTLEGVQLIRRPDREHPYIIFGLHTDFFPQVFHLINMKGQIERTGYHAGRLLSMANTQDLIPLMEDTNADGRPEILISGTSNEYNRACLLVIDPWIMAGQAPHRSPAYTLSTQPSQGYLHHILLPRSRFNEAFALRNNAMLLVRKGPHYILTSSETASPLQNDKGRTVSTNGILYTFTDHFELHDVQIHDDLKIAAQEKGFPCDWEAERQRLGAGLERWKDGGWHAVPLSPDSPLH